MKILILSDHILPEHVGGAKQIACRFARGLHVPGHEVHSAAITDGAPLEAARGYINGEMVTIDGGAHRRSSGAEDLLNWTPAQWDALRPKY